MILSPALLLFEMLQLGWHIGNGTFRVWLRAVRAYRHSLHDIRAKRRGVQRGRKVPDSDILRDAPLPLTIAVRDGAIAGFAITAADRLLRHYWRLVRRWI